MTGSATLASPPRQLSAVAPLCRPAQVSLPSYCCWPGVYCCSEDSGSFLENDDPFGCSDGMPAAVHHLAMRGWNLSGSLSKPVIDAWEQLSDYGLRSIDLSSNAITGSIPRSIGKLTHMRSLNFNLNRECCGPCGCLCNCGWCWPSRMIDRHVAEICSRTRIYNGVAERRKTKRMMCRASLTAVCIMLRHRRLDGLYPKGDLRACKIGALLCQLQQPLKPSRLHTAAGRAVLHERAGAAVQLDPAGQQLHRHSEHVALRRPGAA